MIDKSIYVIAKIFDQQGCIAYRCKTLNEARCLPGTLEALRAEGVQIVILDDPDIYSEYAPYEYIEDMKEFIEKYHLDLSFEKIFEKERKQFHKLTSFQFLLDIFLINQRNVLLLHHL